MEEEDHKFLVEVMYANDSVELYDGFTETQAQHVYLRENERMQFDSEILSVKLKKDS